MTISTLIEQALVKRGEKDGKPYYFVEVMEPQRKFINVQDGDYASIEALEDLAKLGQPIDQLKLHQRGKSLIFSYQDL